MSDNELIQRITQNQKVMSGRPVIRGTRLTVDFILNLFAHGAAEEEVLGEYPGLCREDLQACFLFARKTIEDSTYLPLETESA